MKMLIVMTGTLVFLTSCKLAHMTYSCEYYGCNDGLIPGCMQE